MLLFISSHWLGFACAVIASLVCFRWGGLRKRIIQSRATYLVTLLIWILGVLYCVRTTKLKELLATDVEWGTNAEALKVVLTIVFIVSSLHQFLIFNSLHQLDHEHEFADSFRPWYGMPGEWFLRISAVITLLCICGEIPHLLKEYSVDHDAAPQITDLSENKEGVRWYAYCSLVLFGCLLIWDICCCFTRGFYKTVQEWFDAFQPWLKSRTIPNFLALVSQSPLFFSSDLFGSLTWALLVLALENKKLSWLVFVTIATLLFYAVVILFRTGLVLWEFFNSIPRNLSTAQPSP